MTYCAGWKYASSVYLIADMAITKDSPPTTPKSNFGELHTMVKGRYVEESLLKLAPISDGVSIAFAGNVALANAIIDFLKDNIELYSGDLRSLLSSVTASLGPFAVDRRVEIILAASYLNAEPQLLYWNTSSGLDTSESDYYHIGSLVSYHASITPNVISMLAKRNLDPHRFLPIMTSVVQSFGVHDNLIEQNIGGLIIGLRTHLGKNVWQDDTNYILYDADFKNTHWISALVRDNVAITNSSLTNEIRCFAHSATIESLQAWQDNWLEYISDHLKKNPYKYWVFIRTTDKLITFIHREDPNAKSRYISLDRIDDEKYDIGMSPVLMSLLTQPLITKGDDSIPFRLNVRND